MFLLKCETNNYLQCFMRKAKVKPPYKHTAAQEISRHLQKDTEKVVLKC